MSTASIPLISLYTLNVLIYLLGPSYFVYILLTCQSEWPVFEGWFPTGEHDWVAVKELDLSYQTYMSMYKVVGFLDYGNFI